jgi:hypothetical protein
MFNPNAASTLKRTACISSSTIPHKHASSGLILKLNESSHQAEVWYACEQTLSDGKQIGAAVMNHPQNPRTLWHNHPDIRMINPCIVAPAEVKLKAGKALLLRYRVVTFDGKLPNATLDKLAAEWVNVR